MALRTWTWLDASGQSGIWFIFRISSRRWRSLDSSSGPTKRLVWCRFLIRWQPYQFHMGSLWHRFIFNSCCWFTERSRTVTWSVLLVLFYAKRPLSSSSPWTLWSSIQLDFWSGSTEICGNDFHNGWGSGRPNSNVETKSSLGSIFDHCYGR